MLVPSQGVEAITLDVTGAPEFDEFVAADGHRLRRALVARYGVDVGNDVQASPGSGSAAPGLEETVVRGHRAAVLRDDGAITLNWEEAPDYVVMLNVPTEDLDAALAVSSHLVSAQDVSLAGLIEEILTADLPDEYQAWRDARGRPPVMFAGVSG